MTMEGAQANCGPTFFRGKLSKVLRLSIRDLPSFASKSPATLSILKVTPQDSRATQNTLEYVKRLLLQSSQALAQNQQTIKALLIERNKLQAERDARPTCEEFKFLQEQLEAQHELSRMNRVQIKQLQTLSEQQDLALSQTELRFHEVNQTKNELVNKLRSLNAAQTEHNARVTALERQLQMSRSEILKLTEELRSKADDLQNCQERLQISVGVQNELKDKILSSLSLNHGKEECSEQLDDGLLLKSFYSLVCVDQEQCPGSAVSNAEMTEKIRSALEHYRKLSSSADSFEKCLKRLWSYIPNRGNEGVTDLTALAEDIENYLIDIKGKVALEESYHQMKEECCKLNFQIQSAESALKESERKLNASEALVESLQQELKISNLERSTTLAELETFRSRYSDLQLQIESSSCTSAESECRSCLSREQMFGALENQLLLFSQEFEILQKEMAEMQCRSSAHVATIKEKDLCISKLQEEIRLLSAPEVIRRFDAYKENRLPLSSAHKSSSDSTPLKFGNSTGQAPPQGTDLPGCR